MKRSANLQKQFFFATWYLLETLSRVSLLCKKRAVPVPDPGSQHSWWYGKPELRAMTRWYGRQGDCSWSSPAPTSEPAATLQTQDYTGVSTDLAASWATCFPPAWICFGLLCDSNTYFQLERGEVKEEEGRWLFGADPKGFLLPVQHRASLTPEFTRVTIYINFWHCLCNSDLHTNPNCPYTQKASVHHPWSNQALDPYFSK